MDIVNICVFFLQYVFVASCLLINARLAAYGHALSIHSMHFHVTFLHKFLQCSQVIRMDGCKRSIANEVASEPTSLENEITIMINSS